MSDETKTKTRYPRSLGLKVAAELCRALTPACERIVVAGSLRRQKADVGDVEILFIPRTERRADPGDMFGQVDVNLADEIILRLEAQGVLERRLNANGSPMYGPKNKLVRHVATGMPVDLFTATADNWFNYLVCRTGPAESNTRICLAAQAQGAKWNPYGEGFTDARGISRRMESERAVFDYVGLPFAEPEGRK